MARRTRAFTAALLLAASLGGPAARGADTPSYAYLRAIVGLSQAPEYRRAGSPGMASVANYIASSLGQAGYAVVHQDFSLRRWAVDYSPGHGPLLRRVIDRRTFKAESAFNLGETTSAEGIVCTVKLAADVGRGDCGFIPFKQASPEWKNSPFVNIAALLDQIVERGGAGAIIQGDVARYLVFAQSVRERALPTIVAVADEEDLIGSRVQLRAMGSFVNDAVGRNVIGVRRPPAGETQYVLLLAHSDAWFQGAVDNGGGTAAILRAAEILAAEDPGIGVIVAAVDGEEIGLLGSKALAETLASPAGLAVPGGGPPVRADDVKAVINLDASSARASDVQNAVRQLAGRDAPAFQWRAMVYSEERVLAPAFLARFAAHGVLGLPMNALAWQPFATGEVGGGYRTDVEWFARLGIPFAYPVAGYPQYHTDGDGMNAVDPADLEAVASAAADLARDIALLPIPRVPPPLVG